MKVTNEQVQAEIICRTGSCMGCPFFEFEDCDNRRCFDHDMAEDLLESRAQNAELLAAEQTVKQLQRSKRMRKRKLVILIWNLCLLLSVAGYVGVFSFYCTGVTVLLVYCVDTIVKHYISHPAIPYLLTSAILFVIIFALNLVKVILEVRHDTE